MSDKLRDLELSSSQLELIEFALFRHTREGQKLPDRYGVHVAKVREGVRMPELKALVSNVPGIAGVFQLRGIPIPAINLIEFLGDKTEKFKKNQQIIVAEFSQKRAGFIVGQTHRIRRLSWDKVLPPAADSSACVTGMSLIEGDEFLYILDLERIIDILEKRIQQRGTASEATILSMDHKKAEKNALKIIANILIVDDSPLILKNVKICIEKLGCQVYTAMNGYQALEVISERGSELDAVITDLEMPLMDGLSLIKAIRENVAMLNTLVIIHSSLSGNAMKEKGQIAGADHYVVKNDIKNLTAIVNKHVIERKKSIAA